MVKIGGCIRQIMHAYLVINIPTQKEVKFEANVLTRQQSEVGDWNSADLTKDVLCTNHFCTFRF